MTYGVLPTGFVAKTLEDILADIEAAEKAAFGSQINTGGESWLGQLNTTLAASVAEGWEVLNAVYRSLYPDSATDEALDNICAITGVSRLPATRSTMDVFCTGTPGSPILAGRVVSVAGSGERFFSTADATLDLAGEATIAFESENFGPIQALAGTLVIETPVAGWSTAANLTDATRGRDLESDVDLRFRRIELLQAQGNATLEAIRSDVLSVDDIEKVFVYENVTNITDIRNLPPKSIEVIASGGTDADVAEAIFLSKAAGIETYGHPPNDVTEIVTDSQGIDHEINFTRPDDITIYFDITLQVTSDFPVDGVDQLKLALVQYGQTLGAGDDVIAERAQAAVFTVDGVYDITTFLLDTIPVPVGTGNIAVADRDAADIQSANISISTVTV